MTLSQEFNYLLHGGFSVDLVGAGQGDRRVHGDAPNRIPLVELETRWDYADPAYANGIPETFTIDQSTHSLFGASKVASDILAQEYGRYFGMNVAHISPARCARACARGACPRWASTFPATAM